MGLLPESYAPGAAGHLAHSDQLATKANNVCDLDADFGGDLQAAFDALPDEGGVVEVSAATTPRDFASVIDIADRPSLTLRGYANPGGGAETASVVRYTGSDTRFIDARSPNGLTLEGIHLQATNASFTGKLVDLAHSGAALDGQNVLIDRCQFDLSSAGATATAVNCDNLIASTVQGSRFHGGLALDGGLNGAPEDTYANAIVVLGNTFLTCDSGPIKNPHGAWSIIGNTFEQLASGNAGAIISNARVYGLVFQGNWCGDSNGSGTWVQLYAVDTAIISGNTFNHADYGVTITASGSANRNLVVANNLAGNIDQALVDVTAVGGSGSLQYSTIGFNTLESTPVEFTALTTPLTSVMWFKSTGGGFYWTSNGYEFGSMLRAAAGLTVVDGQNITLGTGTGTKFGTGTTQKIGFYNATPVARQTGVAVTAAGVHAALVNLGLITA